MNKETKDFLEYLLVEYIGDVPIDADCLYMDEDARSGAILILDELCNALGIYEEREEDI